MARDNPFAKYAPQTSTQGVIWNDPYKPAEESRKDATQQNEAERVRLAQQAAAREAAAAADARAKAQRDALDWTASHNPDGTPKPKSAVPDPNRAPQIQTMLDNIQHLRDLSKDTLAVGGYSETAGKVPLIGGWLGQNRANVEGALKMVQGDLIQQQVARLSAMNGGNGVASLANSETEAARMAASVANLDPNQSLPEFSTGLDRAEQFYRRQLAQAQGQDISKPDVQKKYGITNAPSANVTPPSFGGGAVPPAATPPAGAGGTGTPPINPSSPAPQTIATNGYSAQPDPALKGVEQQYKQMLFSGAKLGDIVGFLQSKGITDPSRLHTVTQQYQFRQKNPSVSPDRYDARDLENQVVPLTTYQDVMGNSAVNPAGSAAINFLDGVTGGWGTSGHKDALAASQAINPLASVAGNLAGGAAATIGLEGAGTALGAGARWAPRLGDAAYGAISGAGNADPGNGVSGAVEGALLGLGGGMAARGVTSAVGRVARGVVDPVVQALTDRGIPLTVGQTFGGTARTLENKAMSIPIVGDAIRNRYSEGFGGFNRAAFDEALSGIGGQAPADLGNAGIDAAQNAVSGAYRNALDGVNVTADQPFVADMNAAILAGNRLPEPMRGNAQYTLPTRVGESFDPNGVLTGNGFQQSVRGLRGDASAVADLPYGHDFGQVTGQAENALTGLLDRQAPGVVPAYQAANGAYRRVGILQDAVNRARGGRSGETEVFTPSQLLDAASGNAKRFDNTQGTTRMPFYDLASAGQDVLPSVVPNSGTTDRAIIAALAGAGLTGVSGGAGYATGGDGESAGLGAAVPLSVAALLLAGSGRGAQNAAVRALMDRPDWLRSAGNTIVNRVAPRAGYLGAPAAILPLTDQ